MGHLHTLGGFFFVTTNLENQPENHCIHIDTLHMHMYIHAYYVHMHMHTDTYSVIYPEPYELSQEGACEPCLDQ